MPILELIALSVAKLEAELAANSYTAEALTEAIAAEKADQNRVTAIEALQDAMPALEDEAEEIKAGLFVCAGKSITTAAGIKVAGDEIKDGMLPETSIDALLEKGYIA